MLLDTFTPVTNPFGQPWLSGLVALIPIVAMLVTLGWLRWKAYVAGAASWVLALLVAVLAFRMPVPLALSTSIQGFLYGLFPIVWILLMAIWMYQVTVISGRFDDLRRTFYLISDDPRVLGLLVAFCFGGLLEALAGFGAPVAIAAAMLIAIGFSKVRAAVTALVANTVPVAFGAVGLPVLMAAKTGGFGDNVLAVSPIAGRLTALLCLVVPFALLLIMDGTRGLRQVWPFGLFVGVVFGVTKWIVSATPLYNLTEVFASVITVGLAIGFTRVWRPAGSQAAREAIGAPMDASDARGEVAVEAAHDLTPHRIVMALVPYLLVIVVFALANVPAVKDALKRLDVAFAWPGLGGLLDAAGKPAAHQMFTFAWASTPGILMAIVALLTGLIYRVPLGELFAELGRNVKKMTPAMLTIGSVVALAYVMGDSGQTLALGLWIAGAGAVYPFVAPILGWMGTYVTGSDTSANILFSGLQSSVGQQIGVASPLGPEKMRALLVGAGAAGGVVGKMISPQSLAVAAAAIGLTGGEPLVLRKVIKWSFLLLAVLCLLTGLMSTPVLAWLLP